MADFKTLANLHRNKTREELDDNYNAYRDIELARLKEQTIKSAGGSSVSPSYLKELAESLYREALKREETNR